MRYYRQGYEIPVEIDPTLLAGNGTTMLAERFNQLHEQFYGFRMEGSACEIVNLRAIGYGRCPSRSSRGRARRRRCLRGRRRRARGLLPGRVAADPDLRSGEAAPGHRVEGPAIVTEFDSTTVVLSGYAAEVDRYLNLIINPTEE